MISFNIHEIVINPESNIKYILDSFSLITAIVMAILTFKTLTLWKDEKNISKRCELANSLYILITSFEKIMLNSKELDTTQIDFKKIANDYEKLSLNYEIIGLKDKIPFFAFVDDNVTFIKATKNISSFYVFDLIRNAPYINETQQDINSKMKEVFNISKEFCKSEIKKIYK